MAKTKKTPKVSIGNYFDSNGNATEWRFRVLNEMDNTNRPHYSRNKEPNSEMVNYYSGVFTDMYSIDEEAIDLTFEKYCDSTNKVHVFARIVILNSLYSTYLKRNQMLMLTEVLVNHCTSSFEKYDSTVVDYICDEYDKIHYAAYENKYNPRSFVSKYFNRINKNEYPIYDSYVETMLKWYRHQFNDRFNFEISDLKKYDKFKQILCKFKRVFNLDCSLKTVDMFLWTAGKEFFPQYVDKELHDKYKPQKNQKQNNQ